MNIHPELQKYNSNKCDMVFFRKWCLKKHQQIHGSKHMKKCNFYSNEKDCPYSIIGCKFLHANAAECKFGKDCKATKCQYKHFTINFSH